MDSPATIFGGGILFVSLGGIFCLVTDLDYPFLAQVVMAVIGISVGWKVSRAKGL